MSSLSVTEKHERIREVLARLTAAQDPQVAVRLFSRTATGVRALRGLLNPQPGSGPAPRADASALPAPFRPAAPIWAESLRTGEELQVVVDAPRGGYLHLFNLGTSGEVKKLLPAPGGRATVERGRAYLVSPGAGATPFFPDGPRSEPWVEQGPANGFPERVLAVVTTEARALPPSGLHPAWGEAAFVRGAGGGGFAAATVEAVLSAWPVTEWCWGYCEIAVVG